MGESDCAHHWPIFWTIWHFMNEGGVLKCVDIISSPWKLCICQCGSLLQIIGGVWECDMIIGSIFLSAFLHLELNASTEQSLERRRVFRDLLDKVYGSVIVWLSFVLSALFSELICLCWLGSAELDWDGSGELINTFFLKQGVLECEVLGNLSRAWHVVAGMM